jgi:hypothetical protein
MEKECHTQRLAGTVDSPMQAGAAGSVDTEYCWLALYPG